MCSVVKLPLINHREHGGKEEKKADYFYYKVVVIVEPVFKGRSNDHSE